MEDKKGIPWKKIGAATIETIKAIGYGDILLRLRVDKLLPFILYAFFLAMVSIFMSYKAEQPHPSSLEERWSLSPTTHSRTEW